MSSTRAPGEHSSLPYAHDLKLINHRERTPDHVLVAWSRLLYRFATALSNEEPREALSGLYIS